MNIASNIPHAFEAAIDSFHSNEGDENLENLARMWPLYLDNDTRGRSQYWRKINKNLKKHISKAFVLENRAGNMGRPDQLMFLDWAKDRNGEQMFGDQSDYVSSDYPDSVRDALSSLGVSVPTWYWLCEQLDKLRRRHVWETRRRSKEWCSDLAKVILCPREPKGERKYARDLGDIDLIPLSNGEWRSSPSEDNPIYFPANLGTPIPPGLPLSLVDDEACSCPQRRKLFRLLGVQDCDIPQIVERIFDYHAEFQEANPVHIIAHLKYLYKMEEHVEFGDLHEIWFKAPPSQHFLKGSRAYVDISVNGQLKQVFSGYSKAYFLDDRYFEGLNVVEKVKLAEWLTEKAEVATIPRLISSYELHSDFQWLLENKKSEVLTLLRQHWKVYRKELTHTAIKALGHQDFLCSSGKWAALHSTYMPLPNLVEKTELFADSRDCAFLALPSNSLDEWKFLSKLGVGKDEGLDFYLWILNQSGFKNHRDVDKAKKLYLAIQSSAALLKDKEKIK